MITQVGRQFLVELFTVDEIAKGHGLPFRGKEIFTLIGAYHDEHAALKGPSPEREQLASEMYKLYCQGHSCEEVGKAFGYATFSAYMVMKNAGYRMRERGAGGRLEQLRLREGSTTL